MSEDRPIRRLLKRYVLLAALGYVIAVVVLLAATGALLADLYDRHVAVRSAAEMLRLLEARNAPSRALSSRNATAPTGSPFLDGRTVTVAGAALLQRVANAVTRIGGNVLSSQVDVGNVPSRPNFVSLLLICEIDGSALGPLLYDIEAGMPFLFVDQLTVQAPQSISKAGGGSLRITLGVSGQWQGATP